MPTLILVRVGLDVSTDDVDKSVKTLRAAENHTRHDTGENPVASVLDIRASHDQGRSSEFSLKNIEDVRHEMEDCV